MLVANTKRNLSDRHKLVAKNIRYYWHKKKAAEQITQTEFSKQMGWSHSVFGQYLNGRAACGTTAVFKIAKGLGCTPYDIDPELRAECAAPADDSAVLRASLNKMSFAEKRKIIRSMAENLSAENLSQTVADLAAMLADASYKEVPKVTHIPVRTEDPTFTQQRAARDFFHRKIGR